VPCPDSDRDLGMVGQPVDDKIAIRGHRVEAFSPSTNLLPIRRLNLGVGQAAKVQAAWLRFLGFTLESLPPVRGIPLRHV
jgi:hypothetical protein